LLNRANLVGRAKVLGDVFERWVTGSIGLGNGKESNADSLFRAGTNVATDDGAIPAWAVGVTDPRSG